MLLDLAIIDSAITGQNPQCLDYESFGLRLRGVTDHIHAGIARSR